MVGMALQEDCVKMLGKIENQRNHARLMRQEMEESKILLSLTESQLRLALRQKDDAEQKEAQVRAILRDTNNALNHRTERYLRVIRGKREVTMQLTSVLMEAIERQNRAIGALRRELRMERERGMMTVVELAQRREALLNPPKKKGKKGKLKGKKGKLKGKMKGILLTAGKGKKSRGKSGRRRVGSSSPSRGRRQ